MQLKKKKQHPTQQQLSPYNRNNACYENISKNKKQIIQLEGLYNTHYILIPHIILTQQRPGVWDCVNVTALCFSNPRAVAQGKIKMWRPLLKNSQGFQDRALSEVWALPRLGACVTAQVTYPWNQPRKASSRISVQAAKAHTRQPRRVGPRRPPCIILTSHSERFKADSFSSKLWTSESPL